MLQISGGQMVAGGLDVSPESGSLIPVDASTSLRPEFAGFIDLSHTQPKLSDRGVVTFEFDWEAPLTPGTYTLWGAGNSVNLMSGSGGDAAAATTIDITVMAMTANAPGETSREGLPPLLVTGYDMATGDLDLTYTNDCGTDTNHIFYGPLDQVSSATYSGASCDVGATGSVSGFNPGAGSVYFLIVGSTGVEDGSYGKDSDGDERSPYVGNPCASVQSVDPVCTP